MSFLSALHRKELFTAGSSRLLSSLGYPLPAAAFSFSGSRGALLFDEGVLIVSLTAGENDEERGGSSD